jgi:nucleoprotein TPR
MQKQLSDLGRQVQGLLRQISIHDDPSLENVDYDEDAIIEDTDAENTITSHLVRFRTLPQLQAQNQRLLKTARSLARQLEEKESDIEARVRGEESEAIKEASEAVNDMEQELQRQKVLAATYAKERDMYRSMLARQGQDGRTGPSGTARFSQTDGAASEANSAAAIQEHQAFFEAFRLEMGTDITSLKQDLAIAQRERDSNTIAIAKANAQIEFLQGSQPSASTILQDRLERLGDNFVPSNNRAHSSFSGCF